WTVLLHVRAGPISAGRAALRRRPGDGSAVARLAEARDAHRDGLVVACAGHGPDCCSPDAHGPRVGRITARRDVPLADLPLCHACRRLRHQWFSEALTASALLVAFYLLLIERT